MFGLFVFGCVDHLLTPLEGTTIGLWITPDESQKPDIVIYYCHGMLSLFFSFPDDDKQLHSLTQGRRRILHGLELLLFGVSCDVG